MSTFDEDNFASRYNRKHEEEDGSSRLDVLKKLKHPKLALALLAASTLIPNWFGSFFYINGQNERSGHTRLGKLISQRPAGPGVHVKAPIIDDIDRIETSKQLLTTEFTQGTVDNQTVTIQTATEYEIPDDAVMYLLYGVGKVGSSDIKERISKAIEGETRILIGQQNTADLNKKSGELSIRMFGILHKDLADQDKIIIDTYRFTKIEPNESWQKNNESVMQIKSVQTAEETKIAVAAAISKQKETMADGDYYVTTKNADAQAYRSQKEGEGLASEIKAERAAFSSDAAYNQYIVSKAYKGDVPQINSGALPFLQLPTPASVAQHTH